LPPDAKKICSPDACKFFYTQSDSTPDKFFAFFQAAMTMREARLCELYDELSYLEKTFPFWAILAYKAAERAFRKVEAEEAAKDPNKKTSDLTITRTKSKVFADIESHNLERQAKADLPEIEAVEQEFETNPELEGKISDFMRDHI
jgi:hypothetical protein